MIRESDETILFWYNEIQKMNEGNLKPSFYCKVHNLSFAKMLKMINRIEYTSKKKPEEYNELLLKGHEFIKSKKTAKSFSKSSGLSMQVIKDISLHIKYNKIIDEMKNKKLIDEPKQMLFTQVPIVKPEILHKEATPQLVEPDVIEAKNDIELIISKGVRVIASPQLDPMKIIKIIELLKDL